MTTDTTRLPVEISKERKKQLKMLAINEDTTMKALVEEALDLLFKSRKG
jgi:hypothetical protein